MSKPRIFINFHYMELGGAERALLGLLNAFDTNRVDVDLFLNQHTGPLMSQIPSKINLLPEIPAYSAIERPMKTIFFEGHWGVLLGRLIGKFRFRRYLKKIGRKTRDGSDSQYVFDGVIPFLPSLRRLGHYDLAISFLDPPHIVQDKIDASIKIEWIHTDWSTVEVNKELVASRWGRNDYIVSISKSVTKQFLLRFPEFESKIIEIHNILSPDQVRRQSLMQEDMEEMANDGLILCSVGRISYQKNFDSVPLVAKILKSKGLKFHWYVVGPGNHDRIDEAIINENVVDCVHFIGPKSNPYPWIKACDIYVQPSRYEGHSVTVREAQILCKPVIITNYPTAGSQILNGIDGIICGMDNNSIAETILSLAKDISRQKDLIEFVSTHDYGNENEVEKIYKLLNLS